MNFLRRNTVSLCKSHALNKTLNNSGNVFAKLSKRKFTDINSITKCNQRAQTKFNFGDGRKYASSEAQKLSEVVKSEVQHEKSNYEAPENIKKFLQNSGWKFEEQEGDVNMVLTKNVDDMKVIIDFQLVSPFQAEGENEAQAEMTDFSVTVEKPNKQGGITFYCTTLQNDEKFRYMIGNVKYYKNEEGKNSVSSYNGPEFEDLDDSLQTSLDEWLANLGVDSELCDFIDSCSIDKEQREYMAWLQNISNFIES
ncbi:mitochondrial acidic protein MAM33, putative [Plasmodium berghei]|uniref:Mitochondrial acidic protein MAM33, putative n=2 Tax=Plasmodium berghei TaxID=5821 RepID=A0A509AKZ9_PLABA|nr:mitochondrial acidic protein MAM33, putative [Plasmodium berghei ANKA]CXI50455.1 mitochondrial acidic protein MAM33, putative [Plasmodium berghei]SCL94270.1 mitochondrial acidic protein MAM33, putative [Plasmodium berghei]SCM15975.1 mitochondrial acidic protein MAM33, putative [Plasmodium berghei]SCM17771.1 mitochondrial acidic protein MAM33, putative [Plasmodium berghei]SCN25996.1 mitochondrial acidic protein MAM33, putative [Plasmodium berghei]|eukprot:XP_034421900.1 mitochondrial acidic protein MAM33, putative [Plasmodium berghei ANKA]